MREVIIDIYGASLLQDGGIKLLEKVHVEKKRRENEVLRNMGGYQLRLFAF